MNTRENDLIEELKKNVLASHGQINAARWKLLEKRVAGKILDFGCARGAYVKALCGKGFDAYGVDVLDFSEEWMKAGEGFGKRFKVIKENEFPFAEEEFDTVLLFEVLEHIRGVDSFLENLRRIMKRNLFLSVPNATDPYDLKRAGLAFHHYVDTSHVNFFNEETLSALLEKHGFSVVFMKKILPVNSLFLFLRSLMIPVGIAKFLSKANRLVPRKHHLSLFVMAEKK